MAECDRCGKEIKEYVPLNAIPRGKTRSLPFTLYLPTSETFCTVREGRFCGDCVQSFFDWWERGKEYEKVSTSELKAMMLMKGGDRTTPCDE